MARAGIREYTCGTPTESSYSSKGGNFTQEQKGEAY